jgi:hypothetical protein
MAASSCWFAVSPPILATETISPGPRDVHDTFGAVPTVPFLKLDTQVPRPRDLCQFHAYNISFCSRLAKWLGAPGASLVMGEGWGGHVCVSAGKVALIAA